MEKLTIFREYDIRGIYNQDLTQDNVVKIGFLLGKELKKRGGKTLGVGYDARVHSPIIFNWLCSGIGASGITTYNLGQIPTPVGYFALYADFDGLSLDGSIMITGSHNPPQYNGFKITLLKQPFFGEDIYKLEQDFYSLQTPKVKTETPQKLNILEKYIDFLSQEFQHLKGLNIPINLDCGNGIAAENSQ